jgi:hypothetical protein
MHSCGIAKNTAVWSSHAIGQLAAVLFDVLGILRFGLLGQDFRFVYLIHESLKLGVLCRGMFVQALDGTGPFVHATNILGQQACPFRASEVRECHLKMDSDWKDLLRQNVIVGLGGTLAPQGPAVARGSVAEPANAPLLSH